MIGKDNYVSNASYNPGLDPKEETNRMSKLKSWFRFVCELFLLGFQSLELKEKLIIKMLESVVNLID